MIGEMQGELGWMIREGLFSLLGVGEGGEKLWPVVAHAGFHMFGNASVASKLQY
jgi:hypothetical protein